MRFPHSFTTAGGWLLLAFALAAPLPAQSQSIATLTVFAASDLTSAFRQLIPEFERVARAKVILVPGSTGTLAQQILNGAPADVFFAANAAAIDDLAREHLIIAGSRTIYARGALVLGTLKSASFRTANLRDLADPRIRHIAIANPAHAPYGLAAQQALQAARVWEAVQPKMVFGENVQQAVQFVQSGSAEAGIFARSLADNQRISWTPIDPSLYAPLDQTTAVLVRSRQRALAVSFIEFLKGPRGRAVMKRFGFLLPGEDF